MNVRRATSVHESTVKKVGSQPAKKPRKPRRPSRPRTSRVTRQDGFDPLIMQWIRENHVQYKRIQRVSATTIIVVNDPKGRVK